jgi:hypothetical protein
MGAVRRRRRRGALALLPAVVAVVAVAAACGRPAPTAVPLGPVPAAIAGEPGPAVAIQGPPEAPPTVAPPAEPPTSPPTTAPVAPVPTTAPVTVATSTTAPPGTPVLVEYRLERRTADPATAGFEAMAEATLADPRGWGRAGFQLVRRPSAPFVVVLAEGPEVDRLCLPYDTYGLYSCQNGPVVALNADRWRTATPKWTGTLDDYRRYLVGHEVGHLLGLRHPARQCPGRGRPAPLMAQQSTELDGCLPNPWPLEHEIVSGRARPPDLAPPYRR